MNSIFHRVSIRKYTEEPVGKDKIELLMRAAMAAPSAMNQQPWEFYAVTDREVIKDLAACSKYSGFSASAPLMIVPCYRVAVPAPSFQLIDLSAATENILLEADELGLGAVWMAVAPDDGRIANVRAVLQIPDSLVPFCMIAVGHPAEEKKQQDRYDAARVHIVE
ncbi:MAG: nitroreductase family protein [Solobacterium sp.]|nr:nitroreductase family protein [Solobacterium sp.]